MEILTMIKVTVELIMIAGSFLAIALIGRQFFQDTRRKKVRHDRYHTED